MARSLNSKGGLLVEVQEFVSDRFFLDYIDSKLGPPEKKHIKNGLPVQRRGKEEYCFLAYMRWRDYPCCVCRMHPYPHTVHLNGRTRLSFLENALKGSRIHKSTLNEFCGEMISREVCRLLGKQL